MKNNDDKKVDKKMPHSNNVKGDRPNVPEKTGQPSGGRHPTEVHTPKVVPPSHSKEILSVEKKKNVPKNK